MAGDDAPEEEEAPQGAFKFDGLAADWEGIAVVRKFALEKQSLLQWPSPTSVGVISNPSLKLNTHVLKAVLLKWCPQAPDRRTVPVDAMKAQAGFV